MPPVVVDASAVVDALTQVELGALRSALTQHDLRAPALIDFEAMSALRGLVLGGHLSAARATDALSDLADLRLIRHPVTRSLQRSAWSRRERVTAYDAAYLALADALGAPVWTRDGRLARGVGDTTEIIVW